MRPRPLRRLDGPRLRASRLWAPSSGRGNDRGTEVSPGRDGSQWSSRNHQSLRMLRSRTTRSRTTVGPSIKPLLRSAVLWPAQRFYRVRRLRAARGPAREACTISWKLRPDLRRISDGGDREARCRKCHTRIVLLPDDRRQGYCFDCYDSLEVRSIAAF